MLLGACAGAPQSFIVVAGERFPCAAHVIQWQDPQGFDAHSEKCHFSNAALPRSAGPDTATEKRYGVRSARDLDAATQARVASSGWDLPTLRERIDQFVMHYDVCLDSAQCFDVLHDQRGLSVHFLLDLDGTVYQTLDLAHRARHATKANDRSIGIEIAQIGAAAKVEDLARLYQHDTSGRLWLAIPQKTGAPGFRGSGALARPSTEALHSGRINGTALVQHDFTEEQYRSLAALISSVRTALPRIEARVPVDTTGAVLDRCLDDAEFAAFHGVLGHYHVQTNKSDPGPAFQWLRVLGLKSPSP